MVWLDVEVAAERPAVRIDADRCQPIVLDSGPLVINNGWRARGAFGGLKSFWIVDLTFDRNGGTAYWILDEAFRIIGSDVLPLEPTLQAAFDAAAAACLRDVVARLLLNADAAQDPAVAAFFRLSRTLRRHLFGELDLAAPGPFTPRMIDLLASDERSWTMTTTEGRSVALDRELVMRVLHHYLSVRFLDACESGRLRWPMLTRDALGDQVHGIFFRVDMGALRCIDPDTGIVYYVMMMGADIGTVAVVVPQAGLVFTWSNGAPSIYIGVLAQAPAHLAGLLARHIIEAPEAMFDWLGAPPLAFATFTWPEGAAHLGHFLWNEASGFEIVVRDLQPDRYPTIFNLAGASGYEFYAPLETLYPEFQGRVNDSLATLPSLFDHCYAQRLQLVRFSAHTVTAAIRNRVMAVVANDAEASLIRSMGGPTLDPAIPVVVLGLRLSDRTHADLGGFYLRVITHLLAQTPRLTVVIDGLNSRPGRGAGATFRVFSGFGSPVDFYAREKALVAQLRADTAGMPVDIIDCVGTGMRINLFWIDRAQMFVAPWGAGLVKYRWVCNKPGFVFSSRNNLTQPHHLPIYHLPSFMDDPAPIEFVDPAHVTDLRNPGEMLDADGRDAQERIGGLSAVNFRFDDPPVLDRIAALFRQTSSPPRHPDDRTGRAHNALA